MNKPFEIDEKPVILSKSSKHFITELAQGNSYSFCLASFSEWGILRLIILSYTGSNLSVKVLNSLCQEILSVKVLNSLCQEIFLFLCET